MVSVGGGDGTVMVKGGALAYAPPPPEHEEYEEAASTTGGCLSFDLESASPERPPGGGPGEARERLTSTGSAGTPKVQGERHVWTREHVGCPSCLLSAGLTCTRALSLARAHARPLVQGAGAGAFFGVDALARRLQDVQTLAFAAAEASALGLGDVAAAVGSAVADDLRDLGHDLSAVHKATPRLLRLRLCLSLSSSSSFFFLTPGPHLPSYSLCSYLLLHPLLLHPSVVYFFTLLSSFFLIFHCPHLTCS